MRLKRIFPLLLSLTLLTGCFNDPTLDTEGKAIVLLLADLPQGDLRYIFSFTEEGKLLDTTQLSALFMGVNARDMITETGRKLQYFNIRNGITEVWLDPNVSLQKSGHIEFNLVGRWNGNYVLLPRHISNTVGGLHEYDIPVVNLRSHGIPSDYNSPFQVTYHPQKQPSTTMTPARVLEGWDNGMGYEYCELYEARDTGLYTCNAPAGYVTSGLCRVSGDEIDFTPKDEVRILKKGDCFAVLVRRTTGTMRNVELNVNASESNLIGLYHYTIQCGSRRYEGSITGKTPFRYTVENVYGTTQDPLSIEMAQYKTVKVWANMQQSRSLSAPYSYLYTPQSLETDNSEEQYQVRVTGRNVQSRKIGFAITKRFRYAPLDALGVAQQWYWANLISGKSTLSLIPNTRYTFELSINNSWYTYYFSTATADREWVMQQSSMISYYAVTDHSIEVEIENDEFTF